MGHFSDALREMAASIVDLEDGYFKALHEVIVDTERALRDMSRIDAHYVSQVVTVMSSWQEAVQTAASHMEGIDTTIYLVHREDARKATQEYVAAVAKAREERNAAHTVEQGAWRQALKDDDHGDPIVCLLGITRQVARAQCEKTVDAFLSSIEKTLQKHMPPHAQGPLISNTLSTAFQFQMSVWHMIGEECICPVQVKHSDWCGLAGIVQAIVETFPKNCALMFPPPPPRPRRLRSPVPSGRSHLTMKTTMAIMVITMPVPASAGLILAYLCPHTGTLAELAKQVTLTRPLPYFTGVPSIYQLTPRSHPVALLAWLQLRTRNVAHC